MKTYMAKASDIQRKWYIIDAEGKVLGRVAAEAATLLRGKHKATFTPNVDCGDNVIILNSDKLVLTGKKEEQKYLCDRIDDKIIGHSKASFSLGNVKDTANFN